MTFKFTAIMALLLIGSLAASEDIYLPQVTNDSFVIPPRAVIDVSLSADKLFENISCAAINFSAGATNDTLYVWALKWDNQSKTIDTIVKRTLDASTLLAKVDDVTIKTSIKSLERPVVLHGIGYFGFVIMKADDEGGLIQLYFELLPANATSDTVPTEVKLTNNTDNTLLYKVVSSWWQDGRFYLLYISLLLDNGVEKGLYLQAVNGEDGTLLYEPPIQVATLSNPAGKTFAIGGADKPSGASKIYVVYKDFNQKLIYQTTVSIADGKVDEPITLKSDTQSISFMHANIITGDKVSGVTIVEMDQSQQQQQNSSFSLLVLINGTVKKLSLDTPNGYGSPTIRTFNNKAGGFTVLARFESQNGTESDYVLTTFDSDGSVSSAQKMVANTKGTLEFFQDVSGAIWVAYEGYDTKNYTLQMAYLGKLLD